MSTADDVRFFSVAGPNTISTIDLAELTAIIYNNKDNTIILYLGPVCLTIPAPEDGSFDRIVADWKTVRNTKAVMA